MWNLTFFNDGVGRDEVSITLNVSAYDSSLTSSPQHVFVRSIADYFQWQHNWKLTLTGVTKSKLLMPLVQVQCAPTSSLGSTIEFPFNSLVYSPLSQVLNTTNWTLPTSEFSDNNGSPIQFSWADLSSFNPGPSLGAVIKISQNNLTDITLSSGSTFNSLSDQAIFACTIDARWAPSQLYFQPFVDGTVHPYVAYPNTNTPNLTQIQIDPSWAESLNLPVPSTSLTTMETIVQYLVSKDLENGGAPILFLPDLAVALGTTITDGLARIGWQEHFAFTSQSGTDSVFLTTVSDNGTQLNNISFSADQAANWMHLEWKVEHYGYGYSTSTYTVKVAMAVLLLHALLAIGHTIVVCRPWRGRVWTCDAWGSIGGLVVLAMNSRPDDRLANISAGIALKKSWQEVVKIREVGQDEVELLVAEDTSFGERWLGKDGEKLRANKVYRTDLGK